MQKKLVIPLKLTKSSLLPRREKWGFGISRQNSWFGLYLMKQIKTDKYEKQTNILVILFQKKMINTEKKTIKMSVMLTFNNEYVNCHEKGLH